MVLSGREKEISLKAVGMFINATIVMEYLILSFCACMGMCAQVCAQLWRPLDNRRCLSSGAAQFGF